MPTLFWLVDAEVPRRREQARGRPAACGAPRPPSTPATLADAHARYARGARPSPPGRPRAVPAPRGAWGGPAQGVKCLHAHVAWYLAGGDDPVGRWTVAELGLDADGVRGRAPAPGLEERRCMDAVGARRRLDCGTNSTRLLVRRRRRNGARAADAHHPPGRGRRRHRHRLSADAVARTVSVLRRLPAVMDRHGVVAGPAGGHLGGARRHQRRGVPGRRARRHRGARPRSSPGSTRVRCRSPAPPPTSAADVSVPAPCSWSTSAGGSTELVAGELTAGRSRPAGDGGSGVARRGMRPGDRALRAPRPAPPRRAGRGAAPSSRRDCAAAGRSCRRLAAGGLLIGLAGTVSTLAALDRRVARYDRAALHHVVLDRPNVARWLATLAAEDRRARLARPGDGRGSSRRHRGRRPHPRRRHGRLRPRTPA